MKSVSETVVGSNPHKNFPMEDFMEDRVCMRLEKEVSIHLSEDGEYTFDSKTGERLFQLELTECCCENCIWEK